MCSIELRNCLSSTSSFLLKSLLKRSSRASICHPDLYFPLGAVWVRKSECAIPTRISQNSTPMLGEDRFFDEILKHHLVARFQRFSEMAFSHSLILIPTGVLDRASFRVRSLQTATFKRTVAKRYHLSETVLRSLDVFRHFRFKYG